MNSKTEERRETQQRWRDKKRANGYRDILVWVREDKIAELRLIINKLNSESERGDYYEY